MVFKLVTGDLLHPAREWGVTDIAIPTNLTVQADGSAVMGAGLTKQARDLAYAGRYPWRVDEVLGALLANKQHHGLTHLGTLAGRRWWALPTKDDWRQPARLDMIEHGLRQVATHIKMSQALGGEPMWALPRLGCGCGGLDWATQVAPIFDAQLSNVCVYVVSLP